MNYQPPVSVVVVSRDRPEALCRCLVGLAQVQYAEMEVVVVADPAGVVACEALSFADHLKLVEFDRPNISEARNLGISHAAGDIVAFIDDDAVPEPSWLTFLVAPFVREQVAASGGFVRGRNGISYQWMARSVDRNGHTQPLEVNHKRATVLSPKGRWATKTEGTNMAVRRDVLVTLEGFDPGYAFYLDETDLNLRLMQAGHATAIVPLAEVHHGFAASPRRRIDRVPRDLLDIGASWAVFQRKHVPEMDRPSHWRALRLGERNRALRHMVAGRLQPRDVRRLLSRLDQGYGQGMSRKRGGGAVSRSPIGAFRAFPTQARKSVVLAGRIWQRRQLLKKAALHLSAGDIVTVILLSPTALFHHVRFDASGYWVQSGGLFGRADRTDRPFTFSSFKSRIRKEVARVADQRLLKS